MNKELFERFKKACSEKTGWKVTYSEGGDYAIISFVAEHSTVYRCLLDSSHFSTSRDLEGQLNYIYQHYDVDNEAISNFRTNTEYLPEYLRLQERLDDATDIKYALWVLWHISLDLACEDTFTDAKSEIDEALEPLMTMMKGEQK